jgi:putative transposase
VVTSAHSPLRFEVVPGVVALHDTALVAIEQRPVRDQVRVRNLATGECSRVPVSSLRGREVERLSDLLDTHDDRIRDVSDDELARAKVREAVVQGLIASPGRMRQRISVAATSLKVSPRQIHRWLARYRAAPLTSALLDLPKGRRPGHQLDPAREQLLRAVVDEFYLKQPRLQPQAIYEELWRRCQAARLKKVARGTVHARLANLDPELAARKRFGAKYANATVTPKGGTYVVENALDVVQIDHTRVDLVVVDEELKLPLGRPWVSVAIDVATRMICGFCLTLEAPSAVSVAMCLTHAVLPKDAWLAERNVDAEWPVWGLPRVVHADNGADFHGEALRKGCAEYGIDIEFRPPGRAHFGGHIERLIGTLMRRVHTLPGTTYSNLQERGDYDPDKDACMTLKALERWLALEICTKYHGSVHRTLNTSPVVAWEMSIARGVRQSMPSDGRRFAISFLPIARRSLQRDGIHLECIRYWAPALPTLARQGSSVVVRYDPRDMSRIYVRGPRARGYLDVPYADIRFPAVSLAEILVARAELRRLGESRVTQYQIFKAIDTQRAIVNEEVGRKQEARRLMARRPTGKALRPPRFVPIPSAPPSVNYDQPAETFETELWQTSP